MGITADFNEAILEAQVEAALQGHDVSAFEPLDTMAGGYQARCRLCGSTTWVGDKGIRYSVLEDVCRGSINSNRSATKV